jgi:lysophospholipase L1-like esterase
MKNRVRYFVLFSLFAAVAVCAKAQEPAFYSDIQAFKKNDSIHFPPKGAILFVGSSSFTKWTDIQDYFPGYTIINRGFGGSSLLDLIRYADDIIIPYQPKQIVIYCGENDLAASDTVTAKMVFNRFENLFSLIRGGLGNVPVVFVSLKPSPSRSKLFPKMLEANKRIRQFLSKKTRARFADVFYKMLDKNGKPKQELFIEDDLHMNKNGYAIWKKVITPYLLK